MCENAAAAQLSVNGWNAERDGATIIAGDDKAVTRVYSGS
jgi:hypothetical protein